MPTAAFGAGTADTDELCAVFHERHKQGHLVRVCPHSLQFDLSTPEHNRQSKLQLWGQIREEEDTEIDPSLPNDIPVQTPCHSTKYIWSHMLRKSNNPLPCTPSRE